MTTGKLIIGVAVGVLLAGLVAFVALQIVAAARLRPPAARGARTETG